jgi:hypothetical protein
MTNMATTTAPKRHHRRRLAVIAVAGIIGLSATAALAYFVSRGTGTTATNVTTGTAPILPVTVVLGAVSGGPLTPGSGSEVFNVQVYNHNSVSVDYALSAAVRSDAAGGIYDTTSSTFVDSCLAAWYGVALSVTSPIAQPSNTLLNEGTATVAMSDSGTDQSVCEALKPAVDVTAS